MSPSSQELPAAIEGYLKASNAHDPQAAVVCFAPDAVVIDEGKERRGADAIRAWKAEVSAKYLPKMEVLDVAQDGARTLVTARVSGRFDGSPTDLRFGFTLAGGKITRLEIVP